MPRVNDEADPERCKGSCGHTQCWNLAVTGSQFCEVHNGVDQAPAINMRGYLLNDARDLATLARLSESEEVKTLREEIMMVRLMAARHWNMIKSDNDFLSRSQSINSLYLTLERLMKSSLQIEQSQQSLLRRDQVISFGQMIVVAVMDELQDVPNYEAIADRIIKKVMVTLSNEAAKTMILPAIAYDADDPS